MSAARFDHMASRPDYSNPAQPARIGAAVVLGFLICFVLWSVLAPVSGAAIAEGVTQVQSQRQSVQHPYGGVVSHLMVKEGDTVKKGQVLLTLDDSEPRAKFDVLIADRDASLAQEARLVAERDGLPEPSFGDVLMSRKNDAAVAQVMANERAVMAARSHQFAAETGMLGQKTAQLQEQIRGSKAQASGIARQRELLEEELSGARKLLESGYTPKTRVLALERSAAQLDADRSGKLADVASAEQAIGEAEFARAKSKRTRITEITDQLRTTQSHLAEIGPKLDAARDVFKRTKITAPATGSVVGLSVFTEGGVIQPGSRVLDIVPSGNPLIVEARLPLTDVDEVKAGQVADVHLTGVPRNERPRLRGKVMTVSADKMTDEKSGHGYYAVRASLDPDDIKNSKLDLQPGMPAELIMKTKSRTLVDYLLGPLIDEVSGAFRER